MHLLVRESVSLDEAAAAEDLGLAPADLVVLSFSDSDLAMAAAAWRAWPEVNRPDVRVANLNRLGHPMSVDLFCETTLPGTKTVLVRLLGGLDYWRYGAEELGRQCRQFGIALAIVPGDGRPDFRLSALSTIGGDDLARLEALLDAGGIDNTRAAMNGLLARGAGHPDPFAAVEQVPEFGIYRRPAVSSSEFGCAAIVFYRSHLLSGDVAPIDALCDALAARGMDATALFVPSLKAPVSAAWLRAELDRIKPNVIINATAFAARDSDAASPLDSADCPVLQVALAGQSRVAWVASARGLSAADLAMHVVMPEIDGRLFAGTISFKQASQGCEPLRHVPDDDGIAHVATAAAAWARLRTAPRAKQTVALMLSTYPGRADQIAHAVGLDGLESALAIARRMQGDGHAIENLPPDPKSLIARLCSDSCVQWPLADYDAAFAALPKALRSSVMEAWGAPENDPDFAAGTIALRAFRHGKLILCLQPERGTAADRKGLYHDPKTPPRHAYIATYLWLRHVARIDALIHLGAHGTLEWLPGKAVALAPDCAPRALLGPLPVIYPFIVNDPGEAAQAKRRLGAVTIGHNTPPLIETDLNGALAEVERLVDEFSSADGLDPRRRKSLVVSIIDAARRAGISEACGLAAGMSENDALARVDSFLCDLKELSIRDGLHVLDAAELDAIMTALDGRFVEPGPSGAPSRGRADVLPTGRNLYSADPRTVPTPTAWSNGRRAANAILDRYVSDHGDWPRAILLDVWGSATLRTGGEELATAFALLGVRPTWDSRSFRVTGIETVPGAALDRPRVDVTLRISGLFRDMFPTQLALFEQAVHLVARIGEDSAANPLAEAAREGHALDRVFGPADGSFGTGVMTRLDRGDWATVEDLGRSYLDASAYAYRGDGAAVSAAGAFESRVRQADAFVHIQDHREIDLLTGGDFAAHEGGFAAAAKAAGNNRVALYHGDTGVPDLPKVRTLAEECARVVHGRAASPRWIEGQMRHGYRGGAEMAATVDAAYAFAATARAVDSGGFERLYEAYLGDPSVAAFLERENPAAIDAMRKRFDDAIARGLWHPRRNDARPHSAPATAEPMGHSVPASREAAP